MNIQIFEKIKKLFSFKDYDIFSIFPYGSQVYGSITDKSDLDFIVVFKNGCVKDNFSLKKENFNIHTYNQASFQILIDKHKVLSLECISLPEDKLIINRQKYSFVLNNTLLYNS